MRRVLFIVSLLLAGTLCRAADQEIVVFVQSNYDAIYHLLPLSAGLVPERGSERAMSWALVIARQPAVEASLYRVRLRYRLGDETIDLEQIVNHNPTWGVVCWFYLATGADTLKDRKVLRVAIDALIIVGTQELNLP